MIEMNYPVTQKAFAEMVGISQPIVSRMIADGILSEAGTAAEWLRQYCDRLREQAAGRATTGDFDGSAERARLVHHRANIAQMEQRRRQGELCETETVVRAISSIGANFRNALDRMADHLADRVACETDPHTCHQVIAAATEQTLVDLAADFECAAKELAAAREDRIPALS